MFIWNSTGGNMDASLYPTCSCWDRPTTPRSRCLRSLQVREMTPTGFLVPCGCAHSLSWEVWVLSAWSMSSMTWFCWIHPNTAKPLGEGTEAHRRRSQEYFPCPQHTHSIGLPGLCSLRDMQLTNPQETEASGSLEVRWGWWGHPGKERMVMRRNGLWNNQKVDREGVYGV